MRSRRECKQNAHEHDTELGSHVAGMWSADNDRAAHGGLVLADHGRRQSGRQMAVRGRADLGWPGWVCWLVGEDPGGCSGWLASPEAPWEGLLEHELRGLLPWVPQHLEPAVPSRRPCRRVSWPACSRDPHPGSAHTAGWLRSPSSVS